MQVPSNIVVGKIKAPGVYICFSMGLWGALSACTAAVHNASGLMASRFFLGFVEAVFFPGALFYMSLFYTKKQYTLRTAILYSGSQLGNAFGGLFAVAILKLDGQHGLEGWRWVRKAMASETKHLVLTYYYSYSWSRVSSQLA